MRKFFSVLAALLLAVGVLGAAPTPVSAASYGACTSAGVENNVAGYQMGTGLNPRGATATVRTGDHINFHLCLPDDGNANAVVANVGVKDTGNGALMYMLIVRCTKAYSFCDGQKHIVVETMSGQPFASHTLTDIGVTSLCTYTSPCDLKVQWVSGTTWSAYFNGSLAVTKTISGLDPNGSQMRARFFGETWDNDDGLGNSGTTSRLGIHNIQFKNSSNNWIYTPPFCNMSDTQIVCGLNGSTGLYNYTVN